MNKAMFAVMFAGLVTVAGFCLGTSARAESHMARVYFAQESARAASNAVNGR